MKETVVKWRLSKNTHMLIVNDINMSMFIIENGMLTCQYKTC